jgi:hypothetical protein
MGARVFVWIGGAVFVASLALCAWSYAFMMGRSAPLAGWEPVAVDVTLITMFALHHSLCARTRVKDWLARSVSADLLRSVYVWIASALFMNAGAFGGDAFAQVAELDHEDDGVGHGATIRRR